MKKDETLAALEQAYLYMLMTSHGSLRVRSQGTFCQVRDAIAKATGRDAEDVQNGYESTAVNLSRLRA
jgi:hypothetical protein